MTRRYHYHYQRRRRRLRSWKKENSTPSIIIKTKKSSRSPGSAPPRVDLRSVRMSSLTSDLLNSLGDESEMRSILEDNRDFLLEPLEVEDSLAASGSIYTPDMSRLERYQAYRKSVEERLISSKNEKAKKVLTAMRDYVLTFENDSPF